MPSIKTDRFSLATILFFMLTFSHPLEGRRYIETESEALTVAEQKALYGTNPVYILDPKDRSNAPRRGIHNNIGMIWPELPSYIKQAFGVSFSKEGLFNPNSRLTEYDWQELFMRLRSDIYPCDCGNNLFASNPTGTKCPSCGRVLPDYYQLRVSGCEYLIPAIPGAIVFLSQLNTANVETAGDAVVRVAKGKDGAMLFQNIIGGELECITPSGKHIPVPNGGLVPVKSGLALRHQSGVIAVL